MILIQKRHCEVRSNLKLYRTDLLIGDCFVPRNDALFALRKYPGLIFFCAAVVTVAVLVVVAVLIIVLPAAITAATVLIVLVIVAAAVVIIGIVLLKVIRAEINAVKVDVLFQFQCTAR